MIQIGRGMTFKTHSGAKAIVQGRIYVANEYPTTVLVTMSIVSKKTWDFAPNYPESKKNLSVLMKNRQI